MFRFNMHNQYYRNGLLPFKYITCFGSTKVTDVESTKLTLFKYITCFGSTTLARRSTGYFINLNTLHVSVQRALNEATYRFSIFKYITCFGSTCRILIVPLQLINLNTLHVSVQRLKLLNAMERDLYLNTLHVSVQLPSEES